MKRVGESGMTEVIFQQKWGDFSETRGMSAAGSNSHYGNLA